MVLSHDEFLKLVKDRIGDSTADEDIKFLEDVTDTYNDLANRSGEDWKKKFEDNDADWRRRYKERFFQGAGGEETTVETVQENEVEEVDEVNEYDVTLEDIFTKGED